MKEFTKEEALKEIFDKTPLSATERTHKHRFGLGELSSNVTDMLLKKHGYIVVKERIYSKKQ